MILAISTGTSVLSLVGLALGLFILLTVLALFNRVVRPALEIDRYAKDILAGGSRDREGRGRRRRARARRAIWSPRCRPSRSPISKSSREELP